MYHYIIGLVIIWLSCSFRHIWILAASVKLICVVEKKSSNILNNTSILALELFCVDLIIFSVASGRLLKVCSLVIELSLLFLC